MSKLARIPLIVVILATIAIAEPNQIEAAQVQREPNSVLLAESQQAKPSVHKDLNGDRPKWGDLNGDSHRFNISDIHTPLSHPLLCLPSVPRLSPAQILPNKSLPLFFSILLFVLSTSSFYEARSVNVEICLIDSTFYPSFHSQFFPVVSFNLCDNAHSL